MALATRQGLLAPDASYNVPAQNRKRHQVKRLVHSHVENPDRPMALPDDANNLRGLDQLAFLRRPPTHASLPPRPFAATFYGATRTVGVLGRSTADVFSARS
jgi:hypothetical protein